MNPPIKYRTSEIDYDQTEIEAVLEVVRSKWLSVGPTTAEFEQRFAALHGAEHAVAVSSGTAALHLALLAAGVRPSDEVLAPSYTFVATVNPVIHVGATPTFVDIVGPGDLNIDPDDMAAKITSRTKAVVVVHLAGFPADMEAINAIANQHGLVVIEDACHAVGARLNLPNRPYAGTLGTAGCFSFFANKNLATGEGGMVVTNDEQVAQRVRLARSHGMSKTSWDKGAGRATDYDIQQIGFNYRCTELTAALGLAQLDKLLPGNQQRRQLVARYRKRLADVPGLTIPFADRLDDSAHHIFAILLDAAEFRGEFRQRLLADGIQTTIHYPPVHTFTHYRQSLSCDPKVPWTEDCAAREVTLPLHPLLQVSDIDVICAAVARAMAARPGLQLRQAINPTEDSAG